MSRGGRCTTKTSPVAKFFVMLIIYMNYQNLYIKYQNKYLDLQKGGNRKAIETRILNNPEFLSKYEILDQTDIYLLVVKRIIDGIKFKLIIPSDFPFKPIKICSDGYNVKYDVEKFSPASKIDKILDEIDVSKIDKSNDDYNSNYCGVPKDMNGKIFSIILAPYSYPLTNNEIFEIIKNDISIQHISKLKPIASIQDNFGIAIKKQFSNNEFIKNDVLKKLSELLTTKVGYPITLKYFKSDFTGAAFYSEEHLTKLGHIFGYDQAKIFDVLTKTQDWSKKLEMDFIYIAFGDLDRTWEAWDSEKIDVSKLTDKGREYYNMYKGLA